MTAMWARDKIWRVRGAFDELEIELDPRPTVVADDDAISRTRRHLRALLEGLDDAAEAHRVLLEIYTRVLGFSGSDDRSGVSGLEAGSRYAQIVGERLDAAASMGRLVVRVIERERAPGPSAGPPPVPIFKPLPVAPEPETSWIGLALVDQNEAPVPDRPYRVVAAEGGVSEGTLDDAGTAVVPRPHTPPANTSACSMCLAFPSLCAACPCTSSPSRLCVSIAPPTRRGFAPPSPGTPLACSCSTPSCVLAGAGSHAGLSLRGSGRARVKVRTTDSARS